MELIHSDSWYVVCVVEIRDFKIVGYGWLRPLGTFSVDWVEYGKRARRFDACRHLRFRQETEDGRFTMSFYELCFNTVKWSLKFKRARLARHLERKMYLEDIETLVRLMPKFTIVYDYYEPVNPLYPYYWDFDPFCLDPFDSCEYEAHFRVVKGDSTECFTDASNFHCPQGTVCSEMEGLCLMLIWLAYPCQ